MYHQILTLSKNSVREPEDPPPEENQALNLTIHSPTKTQLVEPIIPRLEPHSNRPVLQHLLHNEVFQRQIHQCVDCKLTNVLEKLIDLISSFTASTVFNDDQKDALREFQQREISNARLPTEEYFSVVVPDSRNLTPGSYTSRSPSPQHQAHRCKTGQTKS